MVLCPLLPRVSGVFGVKKFFKFLQKEGFGADFHPSKQLPRGSESGFNLSPARFASQIFLKIFPVLPPDSQMTGQSGRQIARQPAPR